MPATLDILEAKRAEIYAELTGSSHDCGAVNAVVGWLEGQMTGIYRFAIDESKGDRTVREVFELWDKMVSICDFFIEHVRVIGQGSPCPVSYDGLLDLRLACDEKREFHRCCQ